GEAQRFIYARGLSDQWWTLFESPPLTRLIEQALNASPTLISAKAALRQARELVLAQRGSLFPSVQGSFATSRQQASGALSPPLSTSELNFDLYTTQAALSFTLDVFGANRRQVEALLGSAEAQAFQLEAAYLTLTASLATAAIQEASLRSQIAAAREIIDISEKSLALVRRQFELGAGAGAGRSAGAREGGFAEVREAPPPLQKQFE